MACLGDPLAGYFGESPATPFHRSPEMMKVGVYLQESTDLNCLRLDPGSHVRPRLEGGAHSWPDFSGGPHLGHRGVALEQWGVRTQARLSLSAGAAVSSRPGRRGGARRYGGSRAGLAVGGFDERVTPGRLVVSASIRAVDGGVQWPP